MNETKIDAMRLSPSEQVLLREMIVRQHLKGNTPKQITEILDVKSSFVCTTIRTFKNGGWEFIFIKVMGCPKQSTKILTAEQEKNTRNSFEHNAFRYHKLSRFLWDMRNLMAVILLLFSIKMKRSTLATYTDRWGYTPQRPIIYNRKKNPKEVGMDGDNLHSNKNPSKKIKCGNILGR